MQVTVYGKNVCITNGRDTHRVYKDEKGDPYIKVREFSPKWHETRERNKYIVGRDRVELDMVLHNYELRGAKFDWRDFSVTAAV